MAGTGYKPNAYSLSWLAAGLLILNDANQKGKTSWRQGSWSQILCWHIILAGEMIINVITALKNATKMTKPRPEACFEAEDLERSILPVYLVTSPTTLYGENLHGLIQRVRGGVLAYLPPRVISAFDDVHGQETPRNEGKLVRFLMILRTAMSSLPISILTHLVFPSWTNLQIQFYIASRRFSKDRDRLGALFCHYTLEIGDLYYELDRTGWITDTIRLSKSKIKPNDSSRRILSRIYCGETFFTEREITARGKIAKISLLRTQSDYSKAHELIAISPGYEQMQYNCQSMAINLFNRIKDDRGNGSPRTRTGYRN